MRFPTPPERGWILELRLFGVPVLFHWSFPALGAIGGVFAVSAAGSLAIALPVFASASAAYLVLVLIHELGHAAMAKAVGIRISRIIIAGTAGWCVPSNTRSDARNLLFYSGGILAQVTVLVATLLSIAVLGPPSNLPLSCSVFVFTLVNAVGIAWNAIPIQGRNDGALIAAAIRRIRAGYRND